MGCLLCSGKLKKKAKKQQSKKSVDQIPSREKLNPPLDVKSEASKDGGSGRIAAHTFTFCELATATKNFRADCLLGEGGFGRVYKGRLESTNQVYFPTTETLGHDFKFLTASLRKLLVK